VKVKRKIEIYFNMIVASRCNTSKEQRKVNNDVVCEPHFKFILAMKK